MNPDTASLNQFWPASKWYPSNEFAFGEKYFSCILNPFKKSPYNYYIEICNSNFDLKTVKLAIIIQFQPKNNCQPLQSKSKLDFDLMITLQKKLIMLVQMPFSLNTFHPDIKEGISLITAVKNRHELLKDALKTWVSHDEINEIIIVDWDSDESLVPMINEFRDNRILIIIAENQKRWIQTKAFNLGARFSSRNKIMKIDGDIKLYPGFFVNHPLAEGIFYTGNWATARNSNESHLNGTAFFYRNDFFKVNGYNELLKLYGYDDTDLYMRLEQTGLQKSDFNNDYLSHIKHENRVGAIELSDYLDKLTDSQKADLSILMNRYLLTQSYSWNETHQMIDMDVQQISDNVFRCKQLNNNELTISDEILQKSLKIALTERLHMAGQSLSQKLIELGNRNEIIDLYYIFHNKSENQIYDNIYNLIYRYDQSVSAEIARKNKEISMLNDNFQLLQNRNNELVQQLDSLYKSYSWRFGHTLFSFLTRINPLRLLGKQNQP